MFLQQSIVMVKIAQSPSTSVSIVFLHSFTFYVYGSIEILGGLQHTNFESRDLF